MCYPACVLASGRPGAIENPPQPPSVKYGLSDFEEARGGIPQTGNW